MVDDTDDVLAALAAEAYVYLYPLVIADVTRLQQLGHGDGASAHSKSRMNEWQHFRKYPPASFRGVVRPNFDTLYSIAWLDLADEPVMLSVPDTNGAYYELQLLDLWSNTFAAPGKRTYGTAAGDFLVVHAEGSQGDEWQRPYQ